jgi:hypothetical protein
MSPKKGSLARFRFVHSGKSSSLFEDTHVTTLNLHFRSNKFYANKTFVWMLPLSQFSAQCPQIQTNPSAGLKSLNDGK